MERVNQILNHPLFRQHMRENDAAESDRRFCRHDIGHLLDVARIGEILNLEGRLGLDRELVYGAALLHDIGRHIQYADGTPHELASAQIAPQILEDCGFTALETALIAEAIRSHRDASVSGRDDLTGILYRADKASRRCFACPARGDCHHSSERKNQPLLR